ncbi:hypothetical protein H696_04200 [Fonticula alba]|uniref:Uncharacterized protein n=1 Tax=Fonticula alba TaxID=691883 RepID=A0A058Z3R5_FONAL|nr:hypothetical protein H696_04200 [Fonticula alba]KCV68781.1 hypothetical protein H696_04200 [Fonticula alba]|eukprot:XP_009496352.1 hypothetical protein H696_04200 [Fonticula alba]
MDAHAPCPESSMGNDSASDGPDNTSDFAAPRADLVPMSEFTEDDSDGYDEEDEDRGAPPGDYYQPLGDGPASDDELALAMAYGLTTMDLDGEGFDSDGTMSDEPDAAGPATAPLADLDDEQVDSLVKALLAEDDRQASLFVSPGALPARKAGRPASAPAVEGSGVGRHGRDSSARGLDAELDPLPTLGGDVDEFLRGDYVQLSSGPRPTFLLTSRPTEAEDQSLDTETIRSIMQGISFPASAVPEWAGHVDEADWLPVIRRRE